MNLSLPQVVAMGAGALLIYAAVKNQSPATVLKEALKGRTVPSSTPDRYGSADSAERNSTGATGTGMSAEGGRGMVTGTRDMNTLPTRQMIVGTLKTGI